MWWKGYRCLTPIQNFTCFAAAEKGKVCALQQGRNVVFMSPVYSEARMESLSWPLTPVSLSPAGLTHASTAWICLPIRRTPCCTRSFSLLWRRPAPSVWSEGVRFLLFLFFYYCKYIFNNSIHFLEIFKLIYLFQMTWISMLLLWNTTYFSVFARVWGQK